MLVATDTTKGPATTPDAPPISGRVVIADQSRIVVEPDDEGIQVFYLLDIANNGAGTGESLRRRSRLNCRPTPPVRS